MTTRYPSVSFKLSATWGWEKGVNSTQLEKRLLLPFYQQASDDLTKLHPQRWLATIQKSAFWESPKSEQELVERHRGRQHTINNEPDNIKLLMKKPFPAHLFVFINEFAWNFLPQNFAENRVASSLSNLLRFLHLIVWCHVTNYWVLTWREKQSASVTNKSRTISYHFYQNKPEANRKTSANRKYFLSEILYNFKVLPLV